MIKDVIDRIRMELADSVNVLNEWFLSGAALMNYQPADKVWSVSQNLEHIILTNHYLLILIKKGTAKALEKAVIGSYTDLQTGYDLDWGRLASIGRNKSFEWNRPEHMEPTGMVSVIEIKERLALQVLEVNNCLDKLNNGEGALYKTTMRVNDLGKIDVYHYIYFLVQHIKRHIEQMEKIRLGFDQL